MQGFRERPDVEGPLDIWPKTAIAISQWWTEVGRYSVCNLSREGDEVIAIADIARYFSQVILETYYAGLWGGKHLLTGLLWERGSNSQRRPREYRGMRHFSGFNHGNPLTLVAKRLHSEEPSWSWASIDGCVQAPYALFCETEKQLAEVLEVKVTTKTSDIFLRRSLVVN